MSVLAKLNDTIRRYRDDESGSFVTVWGVGLVLTLTAIGTGVDIASVARVKSVAQSAADQVALSSAVFYSNYERMPENREEGFMHNTRYYGDESGFNFPATVVDGNQGVEIRALYNIDAGNVTVEVSGKTQTALMGMFGIETLNFRSAATAEFKATNIKNPASITLVLDNSGSMGWDDTPARCTSNYASSCSSPSGAVRRIDGLKETVSSFMDLLDEFSGPQAVSGKRVLRTGMIPYDDSIIETREVDMKWGTISNGAINQMQPSGSTNSAPPVARAWDWLQAEIGVHQGETGSSNPLRYMIFMTDGQNGGPSNWVPQADTNYWRATRCYRWGCYERFANSPSRPNNYWGYNNWEEGRQERTADVYTKNSCRAMKDQGVRVFTIGYALQPGTYMTNYPDHYNRPTTNISQDTTTSAFSMLADCASSGQDFVPAENAESLEAAFELIGQTIVEDVVRLSQ